MTKIRTRFAPSPTGKLHIGGARTALFNYIFAKHYNGEFILRCEDTDTKRNIDGLAKEIAQQLEWLEIKPDMSYFESEKQKREAENQYVIRLKLNTKDYHWNDLVRGDITIKSQELDDFVILKNDKYPTYNFSVVIDDHEQQISHILRGEEHITNTAKQIALYETFNWTIPKFGHLTIIVNEFGQKLSKRDEKTKQLIEEFIKLGYPKLAIFNYLTLLG
ncbi:glutamate--tRNA ligase-like [Stegodyphus dumicola]|uniref:glutamate--tRNA ligase-like n=1 Tax=Stegodyphus dumicola TaxID=202533 RepID=UPI0015A975C0|nr:glutamate--tRNA ligase-like [Stegodyphus dumicola]